MEYAIVRIGGKQYKVAKDSILEVERLNYELGKNFTIEDVLLYVSDGKVKLGKPKISSVIVKATVLEQFKGDKIRVAKFKAKSKYRKVTGFRQSLTKIKILDILTAVKK
jgi:large subunit ribosomal protein L21